MTSKGAQVEIISHSMQVEEISNCIMICHVKEVNTDVCVIELLRKMTDV
jgi:hypothetical protein